METLIIKFDKNNDAVLQILNGLKKIGAITVESPMSPSNDPYWNDLENIASFEKGAQQAQAGEYKEYSSEELKNLLKV